MRQLTSAGFPLLDVGLNATTPVPSDGIGATVWSLTTGTLLTWTGAYWGVSAIGNGLGAMVLKRTDIITTTQLYTKQPGDVLYRIKAIGGGGGGGGGRRSLTGVIAAGGGGGEAGHFVDVLFAAAEFPASLTISIGAGGAGAAPAADSANGSAGTAGGITSVGTLVYARGGARGNGGTATAGGAGGTLGPYNQPSPYGTTTSVVSGQNGFLTTGTFTTSVSNTSGGGGGGGGVTAANVANAGGQGMWDSWAFDASGGAVTPAGGTVGNPGQTGSRTRFGNWPFAMGGGGGGAGLTVPSGKGGDGGAGGGGGGGGGGGRNTFGGGGGGTGGRGEVVIQVFG